MWPLLRLNCVCNTCNWLLGCIYPVLILGKMLCCCFFYFLNSDILWLGDRLAQEPAPDPKAGVCQAAALVTLLLRDQWLLAPDNFSLAGTSAQQGTGVTVYCIIDYLISVFMSLWRQQLLLKREDLWLHVETSHSGKVQSLALHWFAAVVGASVCPEGR